MDERRVQCEFFIPIVRDSDKKPHQPVAWNLLVNEIRRVFPAGHSGPETFYRGDALVPGEYEASPETPPTRTSAAAISWRYRRPRSTICAFCCAWPRTPSTSRRSISAWRERSSL